MRPIKIKIKPSQIVAQYREYLRRRRQEFRLIQGYKSLTLQHLKQHTWRNNLVSPGDTATNPLDDILMVTNDPSENDAQKECFYKACLIRNNCENY